MQPIAVYKERTDDRKRHKRNNEHHSISPQGLLKTSSPWYVIRIIISVDIVVVDEDSNTHIKLLLYIQNKLIVKMVSTLVMLVLSVLLLATATIVQSYHKSIFNRIVASSQHKLHASTSTDQPNILRQIGKWSCVSNCGACCKLGPVSDRPDLEEYLSPDEFKTYVGMIGSDDWCINYNKETRLCNIYETRPEFCIVDPNKFKTMYDVESDEMDNFCTFCCQEQISDSYGDDSKEMIRFLQVIDSLQDDDDDVE